MNDIDIKKPDFESIKKITSEGKEFWTARELMPLLEYKDWRNFEKVLNKARQSLKKTYPQINDHFVEITKKIKVGSGTNKESDREIKDYYLTRYACYLIAQNGDPSKESIAYAQSYFAYQTRRQEIKEEFGKAIERIRAREKLKETEKKFSGLLKSRNVKGSEIAEIRSAGDEALFNMPTGKLKKKLNIEETRPLADHLPTIAIKAKDLATEMTSFNTRKKNLHGKLLIKDEHVHNNSDIRKLLTSNGIFLETIPVQEDIEKLKKKIENLDDFNMTNMPTELIVNIIGLFDSVKIMKLSSYLKDNPGEDKIKVMYGEKDNPKQILRDAKITPDFLREFKSFIVV